MLGHAQARGAPSAGVPSGRVSPLRQGVPKYLDVHSDSGWAGDEEIFGGHPLDGSSATKSLVALASAEAELYGGGVVKNSRCDGVRGGLWSQS